MLFTKSVTPMFIGAGLLAASLTANAEAVKIKLEPYVTGVNAPLAMVQPAGDDRMFVVEQFGRIRIINAAGELEAQPNCHAMVELR